MWASACGAAARWIIFWRPGWQKRGPHYGGGLLCDDRTLVRAAFFWISQGISGGGADVTHSCGSVAGEARALVNRLTRER